MPTLCLWRSLEMMASRQLQDGGDPVVIAVVVHTTAPILLLMFCIVVFALEFTHC